MSLGSCFVRAAFAACIAASIVFGSRRASAEDALPTAAPSGEPVASTTALAPFWPRKTFERRSNGLMITAIVFASVGMTAVGAGGAVYGEAKDSCLDQHQPNGKAQGHFCYADRSTFDVGMGMIVAGGAVFAIAVPLAVWAGSGTAREPEPREITLRVRPTGAAIAGTF